MTAQIKKVLLVDDEEKLLESIARRLRLLGFEPLTATNGLAAIELAKQHSIELAIVDLQMPDMNGLVTITKLKEIHPKLKTILLTGHGNEKVKQTTESLSSLYFEKDEMADFWRSIKKLNSEGREVVIRPTGLSESAGEGPGLPAARQFETSSPRDYGVQEHVPKMPSSGPSGPEPPLRPIIVGETSPMRQVRKSIERIAPLDCPVLLCGEPGTGKELAARAIHAGSVRFQRGFLAIDCTAFDNEQIVAQLLGYSTGNLYEAIRTRSGIFNQASSGTLLFDHVERMSMDFQQQLLQLLEKADIQTEDRSKAAGMKVRILAASEVDLEERTLKGGFKQELFDRLKLFKLFLPPLRERKDDIAPLCRYFVDKYCTQFNKTVRSISRDVEAILVNYDFPGNVRELEHIIERAVILVEGDAIEYEHLPARFLETLKSNHVEKPTDFVSLAELETRYIFEVLEATNGNKSKAAEILGISRAALWRKLKQYKTESSGR
ncbi:MAG: sigma-54 dependent transcriptional regulator [Desulfobacteraceae bacterium]|jgi:two-component system response regulator AtoC